MTGVLLAWLAGVAIPTSRDAGRVLSANGCAKCHDAAQPTALAILDLREEGWVARMSESRLGAMLGRLRNALPQDRELIRRFVEAEKGRRRQEG